eukprot:836446-Pelagomonas_calceolata.AAC.5
MEEAVEDAERERDYRCGLGAEGQGVSERGAAEVVVLGEVQQSMQTDGRTAYEVQDTAEEGVFLVVRRNVQQI